ncbi:MAG: type I restriction-modification system subunit M [Deltaproteobacteria bacterium]|nr:type I restriction-modification system subunit M [Deltaproteobacteria bacterium]
MKKPSLFDNNKLSNSLEKNLWEAADKLRKNVDAAEYKHVVLGLIFLKYVSDSFERHYRFLCSPENTARGADPNDPREYESSHIFFVPPQARWKGLIEAADNKDNIGQYLDEAMSSIETFNPDLSGVLSTGYDRQSLDPASLGGLIKLVGNIALDEAKDRSSDVLGHVFEYFLGQFAMGEGQKGGQFYTPRSIVELLVEMLEPFEGKVFDPCCGSGGMFVQSEKFIQKHRGQVHNIQIYGQESNRTTWRLAKMNLAICGLDSSQVLWNSEGSFLNDAHPALKADYIIANPPFNDSDWSGQKLRRDVRWKYGIPPVKNANFAWLQHFAYHLAPTGQAGVVLALGSSSKACNEGNIRCNMIAYGNIVDCIVHLPAKLFLNTQIPAALWILSRNRKNGKFRDRSQEILFIDARDMGKMINRRTKVLTASDITKISGAYHNWRNPDQQYLDVKGFCRSVPIKEVKDLDYVLNPVRYVGSTQAQDDFDFKERFNCLKKDFELQLEEEMLSNNKLLNNLNKIRF